MFEIIKKNPRMTGCVNFLLYALLLGQSQLFIYLFTKTLFIFLCLKLLFNKIDYNYNPIKEQCTL